MLYKTIVADPPWTPELGKTWKTRFTDKSRPQRFYKTLSVEEICAIVPPSQEQSHLWLWVINQHIDWGYQVARAWGFEVWNMITWCKPGMGTGRFQCNTEHVLLCRKGSRHGNPFGMTHGTWFEWPRGSHSEKPNEFYRLVESVSPAPYLEMFSRKYRDGWDVWGDEVDKSIEIELHCEEAGDDETVCPKCNNGVLENGVCSYCGSSFSDTYVNLIESAQRYTEYIQMRGI